MVNDGADKASGARRSDGLSSLPADIRLPVAGGLGVAVIATALLGVSSMPVGMSAALLLCGGSIAASVAGGGRFRVMAGSLAVVAGVIAALHLMVREFGLSAGLLPDMSFLPESVRGAMVSSAAMALAAFALAQAWICFAPQRPSALVLVTGGITTAGIGIVATIGHLLGVAPAYEWPNAPNLTILGAVCLWMLGAAHLTLARHPVLQFSGRQPFIVAALATPAGLFFDLATPPYLGASFIYIPVVLSAVWFSDRRVAFSFAIVCSLFTLLGYAAKIQGMDGDQQRFAARLLAIGTDFIVAGLIYFFKRATDANRQFRMRFDALMDNSPDAVVTTDAAGTILQVNVATRQLFGYEDVDLIGRNVRFLMPEPHQSTHDGYMQHYSETGEKHIIGTIREVSGRRSDGSAIPLDLLVSELPSDGRTEFVGFLRDLTVRKRQEENLRQALSRLAAYATDLERSNRELDDFAHIASHDLKEPLRGIHNHSRFLLEDYEDRLDADGKRRLDRLVHLSQRMERLVNDLLYFSRIGRHELAVVPTDLSAVLRDVVSTLEQYLEERHARVIVAGDLPEVTCDSVRVAEIFRNLVVNAARHNDSPEKIVEVGFLPSHVDETGKARARVYFVRDNGKGIAPEFHEDIFRMFKRLERSDDDGGTGAGLTFVRKIVQRHGGHIWLESEPGRGTTFFFTLAPE